MNLLVTGGCGFIGSNFIKLALGSSRVERLVNVDCLSYAASLGNVKSFAKNPKYLFEEYDLSNYDKTYDTFYKHDITHVVHLAAESHVDNSIKGSKEFVQSNIVGTHALLEAAKKFKVRFHHVSTDEVYGEAKEGERFTEETPYDPRNPYSSTKAASDFLVRAYANTHKLKATISNCSNNYGPNQHDEKLIPTIIRHLVNEDLVPVYGGGENIRDWIYVDDHCDAIWSILVNGQIGETYLVGSDNERTNLQVVSCICAIMRKRARESINFVKDRVGHDFRYAIDASKIKQELRWSPNYTFLSGLEKTVTFYKKKYSKP